MKRVIIGLMIVTLSLTACGSKQGQVADPTEAEAGEIVDLKACTYKQGDNEYAADCGTLVLLCS